ncbi:MAG: cob(I)yrinic acid a,c-diamide adenosyltransferase [Candidatus Fimenecus sp.]
MVRILMGEGAGKTTAAAGLSLRAASHGKRVRVLQLLKPEISPEFAALLRLGNVSVTVANPGIPFFFTLTDHEKAERISESEQAAKAFFTPQDGDFLLVADEIGGAIENGLIDPQDVLLYLQAQPESTHTVLTGRYFPQIILEKADCISDIRCVRHPYENGASAVEGIEY